MTDPREEAKRRAGERAAAAVDDGDVVGLGTGSTAAYAIRALGQADREVTGVPTSWQARQTALESDIPITAIDAVEGVDVAIDGADQVVDGQLIKGGGGAHAREKVVDAAADRLLVVIDEPKRATVLTEPVPLAVMPSATRPVADRIRDLGGDPTLRAAECKDGPVVTDDGNHVLDCDFGQIDEPAALATSLAAIPGVLEHGLFVDLADVIYTGTDDGVEVKRC